MFIKRPEFYNNIINISFDKLFKFIQQLIYSLVYICNRVLLFYNQNLKSFLTFIYDNCEFKRIFAKNLLLIKE